MQLITQTIELPAPISVTPEAIQQQAGLIAASQAVVSVCDANSQSFAVEAARDIRTHIKDVEEARVALTKPLLEGQRTLKAIADGYVAPLLAEQKRVERLVTDFQMAEQRRVEAENAARQKAWEKAESERIAAEEAARKAAERVNTPRQLDSAIAKEEAAKAAQDAAQAILAAHLPTISKATGASVRKVLKWELLDINALYKARPELCKIEAKGSAIQATCVPEMPVPGLRLWWENQTSIRTR
jgi:hypothetical protein